MHLILADSVLCLFRSTSLIQHILINEVKKCTLELLSNRTTAYVAVRLSLVITVGITPRAFDQITVGQMF